MTPKTNGTAVVCYTTRTYGRYVGMLVGAGSDGDERRFTLQRASMTSRDGDRYRSASRVFRLTGLRDPTAGDVSYLPSQDTFHAVKKAGRANG